MRVGSRVIFVSVFGGACLGACSGSSRDEPIIIIVQQPAPPAAAPDASDGVSTPPSGPDACEAFRPDGFATGDQCGLETESELACAGPTTVAGYVYACAEKEGQGTRPDMPSCLAVSRAGGITRTLCTQAVCLPFEDGRCLTTGFKRGRACPDEKLGLNVPAPATNVSGRSVACKPAGYWDIGGARGPAYCCP